ncbi:ferredoxin-dependent glutamate synthase [Nitritalea halalkaliphila LW7]|uniref:Ferredoxin-dependent glutamate synthase n=1 Tax=Nitritalea halalkaliphila LW7 TaxID=1189621 RepID=I5C775_9BACT|nr:ferredoxin-dependent glutamate synthase [Nitritalea halalkaliphila LW7]
MVDLDPLNEDDFVTIKTALQTHVTGTGSVLGQTFLDDWETRKVDFIKVIPRIIKKYYVSEQLKNQKH